MFVRDFSLLSLSLPAQKGNLCGLALGESCAVQVRNIHAQTNETSRFSSYHANSGSSFHPAVSMVTVALDCYSSNSTHGNSLQPWSLGAGDIGKGKEKNGGEKKAKYLLKLSFRK